LLWLHQHAEVTAEVIMVDIKVMEDTVTDMGTVVDTTDMAITDITSICFPSLL
jgi:hypothetical protein